MHSLPIFSPTVLLKPALPKPHSTAPMFTSSALQSVPLDVTGPVRSAVAGSPTPQLREPALGEAIRSHVPDTRGLPVKFGRARPSNGDLMGAANCGDGYKTSTFLPGKR